LSTTRQNSTAVSLRCSTKPTGITTRSGEAELGTTTKTSAGGSSRPTIGPSSGPEMEMNGPGCGADEAFVGLGGDQWSPGTKPPRRASCFGRAHGATLEIAPIEFCVLRPYAVARPSSTGCFQPGSFVRLR
jgi:hypothetical protein